MENLDLGIVKNGARQTAQQQPPLDVSVLTAGHRVEIEMRRQDGGRHFADRQPSTIFVVRMRAVLPLVELRRTADGRVCGPLMYFVGSVATREELRADDERINWGLIVPDECLLVASKGKLDKPTTLPGWVLSYTCQPPPEASINQP